MTLSVINRRLKQIGSKLFRPKSTQPSEAFRENAIQFVAVIALVVFIGLNITDFALQGLATTLFTWYGYMYILIGLVLAALHYNNVKLAGRLTVLSIGSILIDPTRAYWSPGTVVFSLMFTFLFEMVLADWRETIAAVGLNLAAYTYIALTTAKYGDSPFGVGDYFSKPYLALISMYSCHLVIVGVAYFIRREQQERDRMQLLMEQQHVEVLRQFLGQSSHDLRTALTRIRLPLYRLSHSAVPSENQALPGLTRAVDDLEKLILAMLEMSQLNDISQFSLAAVDIQALLKGVVEQNTPAAVRRRQQLLFDAQMQPIIVQADEQYLARALGDVVESALGFAPEQGIVRLSTQRAANFAVIQIRDSGIQIDPEKLPFLFERFFREDRAGLQSADSGLELAIAKKIIDLHGGQIDVESKPGVGCTFTIKLPVKTATVHPALTAATLFKKRDAQPKC